MLSQVYSIIGSSGGICSEFIGRGVVLDRLGAGGPFVGNSGTA